MRMSSCIYQLVLPEPEAAAGVGMLLPRDVWYV